jgi:hypothetical protein
VESERPSSRCSQGWRASFPGDRRLCPAASGRRLLRLQERVLKWKRFTNVGNAHVDLQSCPEQPVVASCQDAAFILEGRGHVLLRTHELTGEPADRELDHSAGSYFRNIESIQTASAVAGSASWPPCGMRGEGRPLLKQHRNIALISTIPWPCQNACSAVIADIGN